MSYLEKLCDFQRGRTKRLVSWWIEAAITAQENVNMLSLSHKVQISVWHPTYAALIPQVAVVPSVGESLKTKVGFFG